jgi:hypothetical protein
MKIHWTDLELEEFWSLTNVERQELLPGKTQSHRLAIAALLKFYQIAGCFPGNPREIPERAILHLARTLDIDVSASPSVLLRNFTPWEITRVIPRASDQASRLFCAG